MKFASILMSLVFAGVMAQATEGHDAHAATAEAPKAEAKAEKKEVKKHTKKTTKEEAKTTETAAPAAH